MLKNLVFVLKTNQDFIRYNENNGTENEAVLNRLFNDVSDIYIPLLDMLNGFKAEKVNAKMGIILSPVLCAMLESPLIQEKYVEWLEKHILLGEDEKARNVSADQTPDLDKKIIETIQNKYVQLKSSFEGKYNKRLIDAFAQLQNDGILEIIATCGTDIFVPHYADMPEVISAQIETGLQAFRNSFGEIPDGFWLPSMGYVPGIEKIIRAYGYSYTILDARSVLLCQNIPSKGIFHPYRFDNALAVFPADGFIYDEIFGEEGFAANEIYRNENCDIGFELPVEKLRSLIGEGVPRYSTGYKYWNKESDEENKYLYDIEAANQQVIEDAETFLKNKSELLNKAEACCGESDFVSLVCTLDANHLVEAWGESISWLETVLRKTSEYGITSANCCDMMENPFVFEKVSPYYSASSDAGTGYGENLISSRNSWMMRYIRKTCERMIDLADRFPNDTGLKTRLLNIGAKELMIAQSSGLQKMIEDQIFPEYAEQRFKESICAFTTVFDSLGSNKVSTEWLTTLETKDDIFPWMNYRIFRKKK